MSPPEIIAHRGYSARAPENTLVAVRAALDIGAPAVEWDVQIARCGTPVLFHDFTLDRTTDRTGPLESLDAMELATVDAGSWFAEEFAGEPVPTLAAAVVTAHAGGVHIYPEIKAYGTLPDVDRIYDTVRSFGSVDRTTFISMDWEALDRIAQIDDRVGLGYIVEAPERYAPALSKVKDDPRRILDLDWRIVLSDPEATRAALVQGTRIAVWTVDDPETADRLLAAGVSSFTTNETEVMLGWAASHGARGQSE